MMKSGTKVIGILFLLLSWSVQSMAMDWIRASELASVRRATDAEHAQLQQSLRSKQVAYNFESNNYLIHEGDLHIEGHFDCDTLLVVQGKLTVTGLYNDYRSAIGALVVKGDMEVDQLYSWGALYVQDNLRARGLILTVYNDFTFEVGGKVNARALVISDKFNDYRAGDIGVELSDDAEPEQVLHGLRQFVPELYSGADHLDVGEDGQYSELRFDDGAALKRMTAAQPIFRQSPAGEALGQQIDQALSANVKSEELLALMKTDRLLAQLISARADLPKALVQQLLQFDDATINAWLAQSHPELVQKATSQTLSPELAQRLASNPSTPFASLEKLAIHSDPAVRALLAQHEALPDQAQGRALMNRLLEDSEPSVVAAILSKFAHLSAFGWELPDAKIDGLIAAAHPAVLEALANAHLNAKQVDLLIDALKPAGLNTLASSLREQAERRRPTRLSVAQIDGFALRIIALPAVKDTWVSFHSDAFLALSPALQASQLQEGIERRVLDPDRIAEHTRSLDVMQALRDLSLEHTQVIMPKLASNPLLPEALQLEIVALAAKDPDPDSDAWESMERLLENDDAAESAVIAATELALAGHWEPGNGPLFHHRKLPAEAINMLDKRLSGNEEWALTLMSQPHASVAQRVRSLKQWYDSDTTLQQSLAAAEKLSAPEFDELAAKSASEDLQEQALYNLTLPLPLVRVLQKSPFDTVATAAKVHPSIALADLPLALLDSESLLRDLPRNDPNDWLSLSQRLPRLQLRAIAHQRFGAATLKAQ